MATKPTTDEQLLERVEAYHRHGESTGAAGRELELDARTIRRSIDEATARGLRADNAVSDAMSAVNTSITPALIWAKTKNEDGTGYSVLLKPPKGEETLADQIREAIDEIKADAPKYPSKPPPEGEHLLIMDLADVHIGKLCVESETGYTYNRDVAVHRMVEGAKALMNRSQSYDIGRVLLVIGNDILHVDTPKSTTTSGTSQDTDGSIFQMFRDALAAIIKISEALAEHADVDLIFCPSNHDWLMGWALVQTVAAQTANNPRINATDYNISEVHRKYYRFGSNLIGLTHADGAKEKDLHALMTAEARQHISECPHLYWFLHHFHKKIRKNIGALSLAREKDHIGMTLVRSGMTMPEVMNAQIEYVRSPSPPDGWHHRNGYINRQAVESFVHHPYDGQVSRFTEWF